MEVSIDRKERHGKYKERGLFVDYFISNVESGVELFYMYIEQVSEQRRWEGFTRRLLSDHPPSNLTLGAPFPEEVRSHAGLCSG